MEKLEEDKKEKKHGSPETMAKKPNVNGDDSTEEGEIFDEEEDKEERVEPKMEIPVGNKSESLSSSSSRKSGRNRYNHSSGRQSRESSKNDLGTRSRSKRCSPERYTKSERSHSREHRNSDSKESSKLISTEENEKPFKSSSECLEEKSKPAAKAVEKVKVEKDNAKSLVVPSQPPPPLPTPLPLPSPASAVAIVDAHSEEANDGFVDENDGGDVKEEEEEEKIKESATSSVVEPISIPVSDMNSVDLHSMIEKKQKNLKVCQTRCGGFLIFCI